MFSEKAYCFLLVHLGDEFFPYIIDAIKQIRVFNSGKIYLVISQIHNDKLRGVDVELVNVEDVDKSDKHVLFSKRSKLNRKFRGGFWYYATERFFYIEDVMASLGLHNVIHIENDTLIYFNVDEYKLVFERNYNIAAVFDNDSRCIPCFVYIKDVSYLSRFTQYIIDQGGIKNDMELMASFKVNSGVVDNLPVIPMDYPHPLISTSGMVTSDSSQYSRNVDLFDSIFDGAAIGQYIGGVDPRNKGGGVSGFVNESALFNVCDWDIYWPIVYGKKTPHLLFNNRWYRINNLHIHSKRLVDFMS